MENINNKPIGILGIDFKKDDIYKLVGVFLITILCFSNSILNNFQLGWDDSEYILFNPLLRDYSFSGIIHIFSSHYMGNYHPLTTLTNLVEYNLFGNAPGFYHLVNLFFHILNVFFVFVLIFKLSSNKNLSFFVALLFGIHPMHVESVSWISERKDVLYAFFFLASLISYLYYLKNISNKKFIWITCLLFLLSILSKSAAICLPILLFLFDYHQNRKINRKVILEKLPFILLALVFGIVAIYTQSAAGTIKTYKMYNLYDRFVLLSNGFTFYIYKLLIPIKLSIIHPYPHKINGFLPFQYYLGAAFPFILAFILFLKRNTKIGRMAIFGFGFYFITIVLVLQIIPLGPSYVSERFSYIPYIGLFYFVCYACHDMYVKSPFFAHRIVKWAIGAIISMYVIILGLTTFQRNKVWKDSITLFTDVVKKYPQAEYAYWSRGVVRFFAVDYPGAIEDYTMAIKVKPDYGSAYYARGYAKSFLNDLKGAVDDYQIALTYYDTTNHILMNIANAKYGLKEYYAAITYYKRFLAKYPNNVDGYYGLSNALWAIRDTVGAISGFEKILKINPQYKGARHILGEYKFRNKNYKGAITDLTIAISQNPTPEIFTIRGKARFALGLNSLALEDYYEAIKLDAKFSQAYLHRGLLQISINRPKEACQNLLKAANLGNQDAVILLDKFCK